MASTSKKTVKRILNVRPDTLDFRDLMYVPTLIEVPTQLPLQNFLRYEVPVLDQGTEGACTGFGLATVANYLLRRREVVPDQASVSPRMMYELARRYDEWPGEDYTGSSARGAMKGWNKHGVCSDAAWPYAPAARERHGLTEVRSMDARLRPLGAYYRVNHKDLIALHAALAEVGVLYATATVHEGWNRVKRNGTILQSDAITGGHAFAIVAYDADGFWIQNSWGENWGRDGFARIAYDDWLANGTDVWVARLGAPVVLQRAASFADAHAAAAGQTKAYAYAELRPHIVSLGNDGMLKPGGDYGTTAADVMQIFEQDFPRLMPGAKKKRLLLYAHGGLVSETAAVQRLAEYRATLLDGGVYPLIFIWNSDFWTTVTNLLQDAVRRRRPEGALDAAKDFLLDRLDDALEPLARTLGGKSMWNEMKENALAASAKPGGVRFVLEQIAKLQARYPELEIHVIGHSAGAILHAPLVQLLTGKGKIAAGPMQGEKGHGMKIASCTLWAPACTIDLFKQAYLPAIAAKTIERFSLFALSDQAEQDDHCARIYNKSLLYLISNAFERQARIPLFRDGEAILGMEKFLRADAELMALFENEKAELVIAPNDAPEGALQASAARHHGDFDDDRHTVIATFARIEAAAVQGKNAAAKSRRQLEQIAFQASASSLRERRQNIGLSTNKLG